VSGVAPASRIVGAVLAAGAGSRMGRPKAELEFAGKRLVDRAVAVLRAAGCAPVLAVVRAGTSVPGAVTIVNDEPERGMRSSLALAVTAALDADALAVLLVDMPGVGVEAARRTVRAWHPGRIAVATFAGRRGHPIVMSPAMWSDAVGRADPDEGARAFLRVNHELVDEVAVPGDPDDVDTARDLLRWQAGSTRARRIPRD
jgi:molybdenum cofactor cytidylyltransferase/nicotine blue oxidoreductase